MAGGTWKAESTAYITPRTEGQGDAWAEDAQQQGGRGTQKLAAVEETVPPAQVAEAFRLDTGEVAVVRRRVIYLDDRPVELTDSYYPPSIARGTRLAEHRKIKGGAVTLLAERGHAPREVSEDVAADGASAVAAEALGVPEGSPVLVLTRTSCDADGVPVEVSVMTMPRGAHLKYRTEVN